MNRALLYCAGGGIGDSLVASLVARALRQRYASVDALTLAGHRDTLARVPDLDDVRVDDVGDERALARDLERAGYEACVITWATARTARIPQLARIPIRVGQARRLYSYRFTNPVVVRSEVGDTASHWSDILLDYARAIGCDTGDRVYRFVPTSGDRREAEALATGLGLTMQAAQFVLLNPCNAVASKVDRWPTSGWIALAQALRRHFNLPVLVSGSPADAPIAQTIAQRAGDGVVSIAGLLNIGAFGSLAASARAFVGISTGSMHVAAAVDCPTVGIFPFQSDFPQRWAPLGNATAIVWPVYRCHRGDTKERCADYACVANLDVGAAIAAVSALT